jgi:ubiquinone/menaquinone biosynthesis C-methylase UbiE
VISALDRARYQLQHRALLALLAPAMGLWYRLLGASFPRPQAGEIGALHSRLRELMERDLRNAEQGLYPRELLFRFPRPAHLRQLPALLADLPRVAWRVLRRAHADLPRDVDLHEYPDYYRRTFHWQTDGWLSERSAALYDLEVETVFMGMGDVMRRMALPPVLEVLRARPAPRLVDLGCGTGLFLQHVLACAPHARVWGLDLSPHYLARARVLLGNGRRVSLALENAERLPFRDGWLDVASCIFLLHELPADARRAVVQEAHRVLAPGGRLVVCDAAQLSDSPELQPFLDGFPRLYHEPFFRSYTRDDLGELLAGCGFEVERVEPAFLAKVVIARRQAGSDRADG